MRTRPILKTSLVGLAAAALLAMTSLPAGAAGRAADPRARDVARTTVAVTQEAEAAESPGDASACSKVRRRLWVEGEGWVVRRVGQCR